MPCPAVAPPASSFVNSHVLCLRCAFVACEKDKVEALS
jgi:hypothetical protein